jgi:ribonuclease HI
MVNYTLHFDGSCGPKNPGGTAAYGFVLKREGVVVESGHAVIGSGPGMTNNLAEFHALWRGLVAFNKHSHDDLAAKHSLQVLGDSNLVVQIMNRQWRASADKAYFFDYEGANALRNILTKLGHTITFGWIPRAENQECDDLSKVDAKAL